MRKCLCGCGKVIRGNASKRFYDFSTCRNAYHQKLLLSGCLPANLVHFSNCNVCGQSMIAWKQQKRKTCYQIMGEKCIKEFQSQRSKGNKYRTKKPAQRERLGKITGDRNEQNHPPHVFNYCIQNFDSCAIFYQCRGKDHTGNCFQRTKTETYRSPFGALCG